MLAFGPNWQRQPDLPLHFGPRHAKITESTTPAEIDALISRGINAQDKIVFDRMEELPKRLLEAVEAAGARPIVRKKRRTQLVAEEDAGPEAASLSPEALFTQHLAANPRGADDAGLLAMGLEQIRAHGTFGTTIPEAKDIHLIGLELENFGPFKGHHTLDLAEPGLALVLAERAGPEGGSSNGCGKSLLTAGALLFALTGHADPRPTMEGPKAAGATYDLVHHGKDFLMARLTGEVNGVGFRITRRVVKKKPTLTFETQAPTMEWTNRTRTTMKLTQVDLINTGLLNLPDDGTDPAKSALDFLLRTVVWNQHAAPGLLEQGNEQAKKVLRTLVQAEAWEALSKLQKEYAKGYKADAQRAAHDVTRQQTAVAEAERQLESEEARRTAWEAQQRATLAALAVDEAAAETTLAASRAALAAVVVPPTRAAEVEAAVAAAARLTHQIEAATRTIQTSPPLEAATTDTRTPAELAAELADVELCSADVATRQSTAAGELAVARARLEDRRTKLSLFERGTAKPECAHCSQAITAGHRETHMAVFRVSIQEQETATAAASSVVRECTALRAELSQRRTLLLALRQNAGQAAAATAALEAKAAATTELAAVQATLQSARTAEAERTVVESRRRTQQQAVTQQTTRLTYLRQQRDRQASSVNPSGPRLAEVTARFAAATIALTQAEQDAEEAEDLRSCHAALADLTGKDGVPNALSTRLLATLEESTAVGFETMAGNHNQLAFAMGFNDKGRLVKTVTQADGQALALNLLSGGQYRRLQLAGFLAFSEVAQRRRRVRFDLRILDEPMQSIDGAGMRTFVAAVRDAFAGKHVLLISHRPYEATFAFDRVLKVRCDRGASSIH